MTADSAPLPLPPVHWGDHNCGRTMPFICEFTEKEPIDPNCHCIYNGVEAKCNTTVEVFAHCCTEVICNLQGEIE